MDIGWLYLAIALSAAGGAFGWLRLKEDQSGGSAFWWMVGAFVCQTFALGWRGELRGQCPLGDLGEICLFLAWSLTLFYLVTGSTYRLSLLGVFTAPVVVFLQIIAVFPGAFEITPARVEVVDPWREAHAALSVLSYGALALATVSGIMFLVLDHRLKHHRLKGELVQGLPSVHRLVKAMGRIALLGWIILTSGVVTGLLMEEGKLGTHLLVATVTWVLYAVILGIYFIRGLPGRHLAWGLIALFVVSLTVFAKL